MNEYIPLKITFHLDGTGIYYDPTEPVHLDALLAWCRAPSFVGGEPPLRDQEPFDIPLPLEKWKIRGTWGWKASALFPEGATVESLQYWRKKFRKNRIEVVEGNPCLTSGKYREYSVPLPLLLCPKMVAYAVGHKETIEKELKQIKFLGKKRAYGRGKVTKIIVQKVSYDWSMWRDGQPTRWIPDKKGVKSVRPRPPYWSNHSKTNCCEIIIS